VADVWNQGAHRGCFNCLGFYISSQLRILQEEEGLLGLHEFRTVYQGGLRKYLESTERTVDTVQLVCIVVELGDILLDCGVHRCE